MIYISRVYSVHLVFTIGIVFCIVGAYGHMGPPGILTTVRNIAAVQREIITYIPFPLLSYCPWTISENSLVNMAPIWPDGPEKLVFQLLTKNISSEHEITR